MKDNIDEYRIGLDYYDTVANSYIDTINSKYHIHRLSTAFDLIKNVDLKNKICLDFGCGEGVFCEMLAKRGAQVIGFEPSEIMLQAARTRLKNYTNVVLVQGYAEDFLKYQVKNVALVTCINTLAYLTCNEEAIFYKAAMMKTNKDSLLLVTHSNELFDMFTMNKYTVEFFEKYFLPKNTNKKNAGLLKYPSDPDRKKFNIRENPLAYKYKLKQFMFEEIKQSYCMYHSVPPLLDVSFDPDDIDKREYINTLNLQQEINWKLMFQCSIFCSLSTRTSVV